MDQDRTWILLSKYLAGEASADEREELEWALRTNPDLRRTLETLQALKQAPPKGLTAEEEQKLLEKGLERFTRPGKNPERSAPERPAPERATSPAFSSFGLASDTRQTPQEKLSPAPRILPYRWIAAASFLAILLSTALYLRSKKTPAHDPAISSSQRVISAKRGVRTFMQLPDGSKLWLNAGSKVVLADNFTSNSREVTLSGEAFFDVQHDVDHPFLIHAGKLDVTVLGTSLNVKAYPGDSTIETTLIKGKVEIDIPGDPLSKILLKPSEKVIVRTDRGMIIAAPTNIPRGALASNKPVTFNRSLIIPYKADGTIVETSWVENKLVFRNESIAELTSRLERWYDVKIRFDNDKYQQETVTGAFKDAKIEDVMHALQITSGFRYRIAGDTVRIW
jgi:transmembrane sensor